MKYRVNVLYYTYRQVVVEAANEDEASEKAMVEAGNVLTPEQEKELVNNAILDGVDAAEPID